MSNNFGRDVEKWCNKTKKQLNTIVQREQYANAMKGDGGMIILTSADKAVLNTILQTRANNDGYRVSGRYDVFPDYLQTKSLGEKLYKLQCAGYLSDYEQPVDHWEATLTPDGINYFTEKAINKENNPLVRNNISYEINVFGSNNDITTGDNIINNESNSSKIKTTIEKIALSVQNMPEKDNIMEYLETIKKELTASNPNKSVIKETFERIKSVLGFTADVAALGALLFSIL